MLPWWLHMWIIIPHRHCSSLWFVWLLTLVIYNISGISCQKQILQAGISNCIRQFSVGCNYLSLSEIPASGTKVLISQLTPLILRLEYSGNIVPWLLMSRWPASMYCSIKGRLGSMKTDLIYVHSFKVAEWIETAYIYLCFVKTI